MQEKIQVRSTQRKNKTQKSWSEIKIFYALRYKMYIFKIAASEKYFWAILFILYTERKDFLLI